MSGIDDACFVFVIGILTKTEPPQVLINCACRSISSKSSANTSNEIGRSPVTSSASRVLHPERAGEQWTQDTQMTSGERRYVDAILAARADDPLPAPMRNDPRTHAGKPRVAHDRNVVRREVAREIRVPRQEDGHPV